MGRLDLRDVPRDEDGVPVFASGGLVVACPALTFVGERGPERIVPVRKAPETTKLPGAPETK